MTTNKKTVLALGFFDGIHIGHGELIKTAVRRAKELSARPAVLTFDSHPDTFVKHERVELICSAHDRRYICSRFYGVEEMYFLRFNETMMKMPWREFLDGILSTYNAAHLVAGHDFSFGFKGEGNAQRLREYCAEKGVGCDIIEPVKLDGEVVSSTLIRKFLLDGDVERADRFLGHPYLLTDEVRSGFHLGRTIDAPTVNMRFEDGVLVPRHGVYAARVVLPDGTERSAVTNIGRRPTFDGEGVTVETHILGFDGDIYGQRVCIELYKWLRAEKKFSTATELSAQIRADAESAKAYLSSKS